MKHIFNKGIIENIIICHTALFLTLFITGSVSEPLWIWTKGCWYCKSTDHLNQTDNTPYTCFHACGENTLRIALQGNRCSCTPNLARFRPASPCKPCDGNTMTACGNVTSGFWSLYERAKKQELTDHGIDHNATGCVVYSSEESFFVENCSKELRSLCSNAFFTYRSLECSLSSKKWSVDACSTGNAFDKLVDTFSAVKTTPSQRVYKYMCWIGLFSVDRTSSHIVAPLSSESVVSHTSVDFLIYNISQTISSADIILNLISSTSTSTTSVLKDVTPTDESSDLLPTYISSTNAPSVNISPTSTLTVVTSSDFSSDLPPTYSTSANAPSINISPTSTLTVVSPSDVSSDLLPIYISSSNPPSIYISPTSAFTNISSNNISITYVSPTNTSLSEIPHISSVSISPTKISFTSLFSTNMFPSSTTSPAKISSTKSSSTSVSHTPTATVVQISPSIKTYSNSAPTSPTNTPSNDFMTTILKTSETFNRKTYVKPTSQKHFKKLKNKVFSGSSSKDTGSTTPKEITPRARTVIKTPVSSAQYGDKDTMVALTVVGTVSAIALVIVATLAVYVRRSMKVIQLQQRRMTTLSDGPTMDSEETVFTDRDRGERSDDFCRDMPNTFSTARRADLHVQGNWSIFSHRDRALQENEYVLY